MHLILKAATQSEHLRLEATPRIARLLSPHLAQAEYADYLQRVLRLRVPLEARIRRTAEASSLATYLPDWAERMHDRALREDLAALGMATEAPWSPPTPSEFSLAKAFGALYVLEGSTLGGQLILKSLRGRPFISSANTHYLCGYKTRTGPMWKAYLAGLGAFAEAFPAAQAEVIETARAVFGEFESVFLSEF